MIKDGRIYARGASDDKGNMLVPILSLEAMLAASGRLPVNVKCFFEGQEEIGSPQLPAFLAEGARALRLRRRGVGATAASGARRSPSCCSA